MCQRLWVLLILVAATAPAQEPQPQPTIRVQVKSDAGPVQDAEVNVNGHRVKTGQDGVAELPTALGHVDVSVTKEGFFPARTSLDVDAAKEWPLEIELQPEKEQHEKVTVYATRNDARLQDSPLPVEVVS